MKVFLWDVTTRFPVATAIHILLYEAVLVAIFRHTVNTSFANLSIVHDILYHSFNSIVIPITLCFTFFDLHFNPLLLSISLPTYYLYLFTLEAHTTLFAP